MIDKDEEVLKVDVAVLKNEVKTLQVDVKGLKESLDKLSEILKGVKELMAQYRGFVIAVLVIGSLLGWFLSSLASIKAAISGLFSS